MEQIKTSKIYKETIRNMTWLIGISIIDIILLIATLIWFNKWLLFCFLVITTFLVVVALSTYYAIKDLKRHIFLNKFGNDSDGNFR